MERLHAPVSACKLVTEGCCLLGRGAELAKQNTTSTLRRKYAIGYNNPYVIKCAIEIDSIVSLDRNMSRWIGRHFAVKDVIMIHKHLFARRRFDEPVLSYKTEMECISFCRNFKRPSVHDCGFCYKIKGLCIRRFQDRFQLISSPLWWLSKLGVTFSV